jgi:SnoaL-like domain
VIRTAVSDTDAAQIADLVDQYGIAFDTADRELILGCFTEDARLNYLNGEKIVTGIEAIRREMFHFDLGWQPLAQVGRILFSDHRFRVDRLTGAPDGGVHGRVSGVVHLVTERDGHASLAIRGVRYTDRYTRTLQGWRIAERRHQQLWQSDASARHFDVGNE